MPITATGVTTLLMVYDMRRSLAFYRDALGCEVLQSHEPDGHLYWAMLRLGGARLMLNAEFEDHKRPPAPPPRRPGDRGVILYFDCEDVQKAYEHLRSRGCGVKEPKTTYYGMTQLHLTDPDGFELCFQHAASGA
jgi:uncharacterized glyoxalase superfamily protein PhnB